MVNIVETYFKLSRSLSDEDYMQLLRNAVYTYKKAEELKQTLDLLGYNWFNFKENLNKKQSKIAPKVGSKMLMKNPI